MTQINSWKIQLLAPEEAKIRSELISAYKVRDRVKIDKWNQATKLLYMKYKINPRINMIPLLQLPPVLFFFWTLQEMAYNIDKYPGMTTDGLLWFKNLSEADPYFVLPFLLALTNFWSIHKNPSTTQVKGSFGKYIKYLKYGAFLGFPITSSFPAAIVLNWFFMSFFQIIINSLIYTRLGRKLLKIPQYLPGSILEKYNTQSKTPVIKPQTYQHKPNITKTS
jgi:YidC/Oxa1 family membrane protein insertase